MGLVTRRRVDQAATASSLNRNPSLPSAQPRQSSNPIEHDFFREKRVPCFRGVHRPLLLLCGRGRHLDQNPAAGRPGHAVQEAALGEASSSLRGYFCPYGSSSDFVDYLDENANIFGESGSPLSVLLFTFVGIGAEQLYRENAENFGLRGC